MTYGSGIVRAAMNKEDIYIRTEMEMRMSRLGFATREWKDSGYFIEILKFGIKMGSTRPPQASVVAPMSQAVKSGGAGLFGAAPSDPTISEPIPMDIEE